MASHISPLDDIRAHAQKAPSSLAIASWDGNYTYEQFELVTDDVAAHLRDSHNVQNGDIVPLLVGRSRKAIVVMMSLAKLGAVFCFMDPELPVNRLQSVIRQTSAKIVIADDEHAHRLSETGAKAVTIDASHLDPAECRERNSPKPTTQIRPDQLMYICFTSGSTGEPKGSTIAHNGILHAMRAFVKSLGLAPGKRMLHLCSYAFDPSISEILTPLMAGACLAIPREQNRFRELPSILSSMEVTHAIMTPSVARILDPEVGAGPLETLCLGGEAMPAAIIDAWGDKLRIVNAYGPSECSVVAVVDSDMKDTSRGPNIGWPIVGNAWIVDPEDSNVPVAIGQVGELLLEGPHLGAGYLGNKAQTDKAFVSNLEWAEPRTRRFYKTGDLARFCEDGSILYIGRKDTQIKLNGQRMELSEIESHLQAVLDTSQAVACEVAEYGQQKIVAAFIEAPKADAAGVQAFKNILAEKPIHDEMRKRLAEVFVPTFVHVMESLPRSIAGKTDRKLLKSLVPGMPLDGTLELKAHKTSTTTTEYAAIAVDDHIAQGLYTKLTKGMHTQPSNDGTARDVPLETLGLDSLRVISLSAQILSQYKVRVKGNEIFNQSMTVGKLARLIEARMAGKNEAVLASGYTQQLRGLLRGFEEKVSSNAPVQQTSKWTTVFMTGATGYIGNHLLRELLVHNLHTKVIVHSRASSNSSAQDRIIESAKKAKWWSDNLLDRLDVWRGDLASDRLGLTEDQWSRLRGENIPVGDRVDVILHCGAAVNWASPYNKLAAANVDATRQLLEVTAEAPHIKRFLFITGGANRPVADQADDWAFAQKLEQANGYAQTKYAAEMLVKSAAKCNKHGTKFITVRPGFVIGDMEEGVPNIDDFVWRMASTAIDMGAFPDEHADSWLRVSDVGSFSSRVVGRALSGEHDTDDQVQLCDMVTGMKISHFWSLFSGELGYQHLQRIPLSEWMERLEKQFDEQGANHQLWPVADMIRSPGFTFGVEIDDNQDQTTVSVERIVSCVRTNVANLQKIGFMALTDGTRNDGSTASSTAFRRGQVASSLPSAPIMARTAVAV